MLDEGCVEYAVQYATSYGFYVVPIRPGEKAPWLPQWQEKASRDEATIRHWWQTEPGSNVGVKLGKESNVIDIECDDEEAERKYQELFDGCEVVTATYQGHRGKHRLFRWSPELPHPDKPWFKLGKLEIRTGNGGGAQSVLPPSKHPKGDTYRWLVHIDDAGIAELPQQVIARLHNWAGDSPQKDVKAKKTAEEWERIASGGKREGEGRNNDAASYIGGLLRSMAMLDDDTVALVYQAAWAINLRNIEPLPEAEFRRTFDSVLKKEQIRRGPQKEVERVAASHGAQSEWKLVIVQMEPRLYELYGPTFSCAHGGCLKLTSQQLCSFSLLKVQALEQASVVLPDEMRKVWPKMLQQLVSDAEIDDTPIVENETIAAAEYLLERLEEAKPRRDGKDEPDPTRPVRMSDGSIWFRWSVVWETALREKLFSREVIRRIALQIPTKAHQRWPRQGGARRRYIIADREFLAKIKRMARDYVDDTWRMQ